MTVVFFSSTLINPPHVFMIVILVMPFASLQNCVDIIWGSWRLTPPATQLFVNISFIGYTHTHTYTQTLIWCMYSLHTVAWQLMSWRRRNTHTKEVLPHVIRGQQQVTSKLWHFNSPIWKTVILCRGDVRPYVRISQTFFNILWGVSLELGIYI